MIHLRAFEKHEKADNGQQLLISTVSPVLQTSDALAIFYVYGPVIFDLEKMGQANT